MLEVNKSFLASCLSDIFVNRCVLHRSIMQMGIETHVYYQ